jgi:hypothetical protein
MTAVEAFEKWIDAAEDAFNSDNASAFTEAIDTLEMIGCRALSRLEKIEAETVERLERVVNRTGGYGYPDDDPTLLADILCQLRNLSQPKE